jgi:hypothetical protein
MAQKTYQKLRSENLEVAKVIFNYLQEHKAITNAKFVALFQKTRGWSPWNTLSHNFDTVKAFLTDHGLITTEKINGTLFYVATQKCWRSKTFENTTKEVQEVTNSDIDKAIQYVTLNNNMVPAEYEGPVVANMLGLEGYHWKYFVSLYNFGIPSWMDIKFKVLTPLQEMVHKGNVKKY